MQRDVCDTPQRGEADIFPISKLQGLFTNPDPQTLGIPLIFVTFSTLVT